MLIHTHIYSLAFFAFIETYCAKNMKAKVSNKKVSRQKVILYINRAVRYEYNNSKFRV